MQFKTLALALLASAAAADSVQELVSELPACAKKCLDDASAQIGCSATDVKCQCGKFTDLTDAAIGCLSLTCSSDELSGTCVFSSLSLYIYI